MVAAFNAEHAAAGDFDLTPREVFWRDLYDDLLERGYRLRPRYKPGWTPPWIGTDIYPIKCEDSLTIGVRAHAVHTCDACLSLQFPGVIDARRESDNTLVAIKWCPRDEDLKSELDVSRFLSSEQLRSDPRNHCNPLLDSFPHPGNLDGVFLVSPWLHLLYALPLETVSELVDFMLQAFEVPICASLVSCSQLVAGSGIHAPPRSRAPVCGRGPHGTEYSQAM